MAIIARVNLFPLTAFSVCMRVCVCVCERERESERERERKRERERETIVLIQVAYPLINRALQLISLISLCDYGPYI